MPLLPAGGCQAPTTGSRCAEPASGQPSQGLAPKIIEDIIAVLEEMRHEDLAILVVEQNSSLALNLAERAYVVDDGRIVYTSRAADLEANPTLKHQLLAV